MGPVMFSRGRAIITCTQELKPRRNSSYSEEILFLCLIQILPLKVKLNLVYHQRQWKKASHHLTSNSVVHIIWDCNSSV